MKKQRTRPITRRAAMMAASEFMLFHYPAMFTAAQRSGSLSTLLSFGLFRSF